MAAAALSAASSWPEFDDDEPDLFQPNTIRSQMVAHAASVISVISWHACRFLNASSDCERFLYILLADRWEEEVNVDQN